MNKKILIIINNLGIGGAERLVVNDINEMARRDIDVTLVTLKPEPKNSLATELYIDQSRLHCIFFKHFFDFSSWFRIVYFIRRLNPDLVITQLWFANTIGRVSAKLAGVSFIISFEQNVYDNIKTKKMFFVDWCLQFLSTKIIAVSEAVKRSLIRHHINESRISVLHNSVDPLELKDSGNIHEIRREYNISEGTFLYVYIGRLVYQKAVDVLIDAFKKTNDDSRLLIVGQGVDRKTLEHQVKKNNLERRITFTGVRNDIATLLKLSDCFVLPSRHEGLPLILVEALAVGSAIIVSDFEAAKEVIIHEKNGLIVPRENAVALHQAMERVKNNKSLRLNLINESKKSSKHFLISGHVDALLNYIS